ncbi:MAG: hypothetical protein KatS3mg057_1806 [Herpetosiphonaceae bacterium]|nr:MAG: hypothetical protein KatS3mg057_1806 [Herpetosiphonaceae bacterium]
MLGNIIRSDRFGDGYLEWQRAAGGLPQRRQHLTLSIALVWQLNRSACQIAEIEPRGRPGLVEPSLAHQRPERLSRPCRQRLQAGCEYTPMALYQCQRLFQCGAVRLVDRRQRCALKPLTAESQGQRSRFTRNSAQQLRVRLAIDGARQQAQCKAPAQGAAVGERYGQLPLQQSRYSSRLRAPAPDWVEGCGGGRAEIDAAQREVCIDSARHRCQRQLNRLPLLQPSGL